MYNSLKHTFFTSHSLSIITELHPLKQSESSQLNRVGRFHFKRKFCKTLFGTLLTENIETDSHWPIYVILRKDMRFLNWISYFNQKNLFLINITGLYQPHTHTQNALSIIYDLESLSMLQSEEIQEVYRVLKSNLEKFHRHPFQRSQQQVREENCRGLIFWEQQQKSVLLLLPLKV